jgi:hypothetical protein
MFLNSHDIEIPRSPYVKLKNSYPLNYHGDPQFFYDLVGHPNWPVKTKPESSQAEQC